MKLSEPVLFYDTTTYLAFLVLDDAPIIFTTTLIFNSKYGSNFLLVVIFQHSHW